MSRNKSHDTRTVSVICQFTDENGKPACPYLSVPLESDIKQLDKILNSLLKKDGGDHVPYSYFVDSAPLVGSLEDFMLKRSKAARIAEWECEGRRITKNMIDSIQLEVTGEEKIQIVYRPQATFRVLPVTRCTSRLTGHTDAVLTVAFSPDSRVLASGSGDSTVRLWDIDTEMPIDTLLGHSSWVQVLAWSPNARRLLSGSVDGQVFVWENRQPTQVKGHSRFITCASWEPLHMSHLCNRFVTASKDGSVKIWRIEGQKISTEYTLSGHTAAVTWAKWGGGNRVYSSSEDRLIIIWSVQNGSMIATLKGHAHWVNKFSLNTEHVLRSGCFDHTRKKLEGVEMQTYAQERYDDVLQRSHNTEKLVSCSDDNTLILWDVSKASLVQRLVGHQDLIFDVKFSPDGSTIASASQDKSIRIWRASDGMFLSTLRGHVGSVYHLAWSLDSRLLISASKDSTLKLWNISNGRLLEEMAGHDDEVYSADWSPNGLRAASGSKDKSVRIWKH